MSDKLRTGKKQHAPIAQQFYPTEPPLVHVLLPHLAKYRGDIILEPCCGDGAIAKILIADGHTVIASDLVDRGYGESGIDFFALRHTRAKRIVSNTPYRDDRYGVECHAEMVRHALRLVEPACGSVAMLLPHDFDAAEGRLDLLGGAPFAFKLTCMWRPVWIRGTAGGGRTCSAWYVWDHAYKGPAHSVYVRRPEIGGAA